VINVADETVTGRFAPSSVRPLDDSPLDVFNDSCLFS